MNQGGGGARLVPGLAVRAGQTIGGKYRVEALLGAGASGIVIEARNIHLREQVTLKILASYTDGQEELMARRLAKARLAARLMSSHVARIVDIGVTEDGMPYVATESLAGKTLEAELTERGRLGVEEAARWVLEACEGLAEAHAAGLVHGDLKPQNVFLAEPKQTKRAGSTDADATPGDRRMLKLLDFGTTSPLDAIGDQSASAFFGSPAFLAPEQIQEPGSVDERADVWALGVLLYNLISGSLPFEADSVSGVIVAVVYDAPALLTDAPYELARVVSRCLEKDPSKRPQDVRELATAIAPFAGSQGARLSERVRAMLEAPPASLRASTSLPALAEASATTSVEPVSMSTVQRESDSHAPLPLVTRRAGERTRQATAGTHLGVAKREAATRPSLRVVARRRKARSRTSAGALAAVAALALASLAATSAGRPLLRAETDETIAEWTHGVAAGRATAEVPPHVAHVRPIATVTVGELPDAPVLSFAPVSPADITHTPLASTPTPLVAAELAGPPRPPPGPTPSTPSTLRSSAPASPPPASPPPAPPPAAKPAPRSHAAPPRVLPPPRTTTATSRADTGTKRSPAPTSRLPAGLPTSREALAPPAAAPARPAAPRPGAPPPPASRADETYLRKLFTDRK